MNDDVFNLDIKQGASFLAQASILNEDETPIDISGKTFKGQVRKTYDSKEIEWEFEFDIVDGPNGILNISLPPTFYTKKMTTISKFVYDIEMTNSPNNITSIARGVINLIPEVTK